MNSSLFQTTEYEITRLSSRELCSVYDPCIKWGSDEEKQKMKYLKILDANLLPNKAGMEKVVFICSPISANECDSIDIKAIAKGYSVEGLSHSEKQVVASQYLALEYFKAGCQQVLNVQTNDGKYISLSGERVLEVPRSIRQEIGGYILRLSTEFVEGFTSQRLPRF